MNTTGQSSAGTASGTTFSEMPLKASVISAIIMLTPVRTMVMPTPNITP